MSEMFSVFFGILLLGIVLPLEFSAGEDTDSDDSDFEFRCPDRECTLLPDCVVDLESPHVYANLEDGCKVFLSECLLDYYNCHREKRCMAPIQSVDKEECVCVTCDKDDDEDNCKDPGFEVCGIFLIKDGKDVVEELLTFPNYCLLKKYSCENGKPFLYSVPGRCNGNSTQT